VADEDVLNLGLELLGRAVEEASGGIGDGLVVVADLVDDDAAKIQADLLLADAGHLNLALMRHQRERPDLLQPRDDPAASTCDDGESHPVGFAAAPDMGDHQGLVGLGDSPDRSQKDDQQDEHEEGRDRDRNYQELEICHRGNLNAVLAGSTSTSRPGHRPIEPGNLSLSLRPLATPPSPLRSHRVP